MPPCRSRAWAFLRWSKPSKKVPEGWPTNRDIRCSCTETGTALWLKIPEFGLQACSDDFEAGLNRLEEELGVAFDRREGSGELVAGRLVATVKWVEKEEYGLTQVELLEEGYEGEFDEEGDEP